MRFFLPGSFLAPGAAVLFFFLVSCVTERPQPVMPEPESRPLELRMELAGPAEITFSKITLNFLISLKNPNAGTREIQTLDYLLKAEGFPPRKGVLKESAAVPGGGELNLELSLVFSREEIQQYVPRPSELPEKSNFIPYTLNCRGSMKGDRAGAEKGTLEASLTDQFMMVWLPVFDFEYLYVKSLGLMGAEIVLAMTMENPNPFPVDIKAFEGELQVNREKWTDMGTKKALTLAPGENLERGVGFRLEFLSMGRTVRDLLSREGALPYTFRGKMVLEAPEVPLAEETLPLQFSEKVKLIHPDTTGGAHSSVKIEDSIEKNLIHLFGRY